MPQSRVNAVVVGAGAAGGVVAKELATAGLSVALLERGAWQSFDDHDHDELISQRTTVLGSAFGPDDERHRRVVQAGDRFRTVLPSDGAYSNNAACVGGGTLSYGAMAWRFMEQDFRMRSIYGCPEGSTLEDWPITYQDLEPCYEKAEQEIGVSGDTNANPFQAPRQKPYPMPPFAYNTEGRLLEASARRLGFHPFPLPMLRNSVPRDGRAACIHCRSCVGFACEVQAKCGTQNTVIPAAIRTGHCRVLTGCVAKEVLTDARGRATGVAYFDARDRLQTQDADLVVVSASATESARLLLNSKSGLFPTGLGNRHDWVGRNLQGHAYSGSYGSLRGGHVRRRRGRGDDRHLRLQPREPGPSRRRDAGQRVHPAAVSLHARAPAGRGRVGARAQGVSAEVLPAQRRRAGADPGDAGVRVARRRSIP